MRTYEWITLDIYDPNSDQDMWDLLAVFDDIELEDYSDLLIKSHFPFIIRKQVEKKGDDVSTRYAEAIGFLFLVYDESMPDVLIMKYGIVKEERNKHFMSWTLHIFNHKLIGNTETAYEWKREYEKAMKGSLILHQVPINDPKLNRLAFANGRFLINDENYYYFVEGFGETFSDEEITNNIEKIQYLLDKEKEKVYFKRNNK